MKLKCLVGAAWLCVSSMANAGFLFETAPIAPPSLPKSQVGGKAGSADPVQVQGRNVDSSARLDRVAKMNRQRIDLESKLTSRITQSGESPGELPIVRGMGRDVTLEDALRQILPNGWSAYSDQDMPLEQRVNWSGNRTWPYVLHGLISDLDMRASIDWKNREIMFFVPAPKETLTVPVAGAQGVEVRKVAPEQPTAAAQPVAAAPAIAAAAAAPAPAVQAAAPAASPKVAAQVSAEPKIEQKEVVWTLSPDLMLRENLRRWAAAVNWTLVWNAVHGDRVIDYSVDAKAEYPGELLGVNGAMAKVISAYYDAEFPLELEFFRGNRVIEVRLHRLPDSATKFPVSASRKDGVTTSEVIGK